MIAYTALGISFIGLCAVVMMAMQVREVRIELRWMEREVRRLLGEQKEKQANKQEILDLLDCIQTAISHSYNGTKALITRWKEGQAEGK